MKWTLVNHISSNRLKKFERKYPREHASLFANLFVIRSLLESNLDLRQIKTGFFRSERDGLYRVGQRSFPGSKESRLYLAFDSHNRTIHLLCIGTKETQQTDINTSKKILKQITYGTNDEQIL